MNKYDSDKKLEQHIAKLLYDECKLSHILTDCLYYNLDDPMRFSENAYENWNARIFEPEGIEAHGDRFVSIDELAAIDEIADLLDPAMCEGSREEGYDIFPGEVEFRTKEIQHFDSTFFRGMYILPLATGKYQVECNILCNEYAEPIKQIIEVWVE